MENESDFVLLDCCSVLTQKKFKILDMDRISLDLQTQLVEPALPQKHALQNLETHSVRFQLDLIRVISNGLQKIFLGDITKA